MKYILCSEYQKEFIYQDLLSKSNGALGTKLFTLSNLLEKENEVPVKTCFVVRKKLLEKKEEYPCYREMFNYPDFIQEIISFAREMILWDIPTSSLPSNTDREKELQSILSLVLQEDLAEHGIARTCHKNIHAVDYYGEVDAYPQFETDYFKYKLLQEILSKDNIHEISYSASKSTTERKYALSSRQEIEAVAQDICNRKTPCNIILCSYSEQYPFLKQVFDRYHIPFYAYKEDVCSNIPYVYYALLDFAIKKDNTSFVTALKYNAFSHLANNRIIDFFNTHPDAYLNEIEAVSLLLSQRDEKKINSIIDECNYYLDSIREEINYLLDSTDVNDAINRAYEVMSHLPMLQDKKELEASLQVYNYLSNTLDEIHDELDAEFISKLILKISLEKVVPYSNFCTVTDLTHPVPSKGISYILGCSGRAYPSVPTKKGLFDEAYVSNIREYPSLNDRHHAYMKQLDWVHHSGNHIIYSYATNDYQGREIQLAFDIKQLNKDESSWKLISTHTTNKEEHKLDPDIAKKLFTNENHLIKGSISSIERYFNCPYSYFIQSGLKVRDESFSDCDNAQIGTISHSVMEHAVKKYDKHYPQITDEEIMKILNPYFQELDILHPTDKELHHLTKERLFHALRMAIDYLQDVENNTLYKPVHTEEHFESTIFDGLLLNGIIDRVDEINGKFRIVDYKSSEHELSATQIKAGLQLQLLTYLIVEANANHATPTGCYYYNMQTKNTAVQASNGYSVKKGIELNELNEEFFKEEMYDSKRLKGWAFANTDDEYTDYAKYYKPKKYFEYQTVNDVIHELYAYFRDNLLNGHIQLDPVEGACTFCDYKCICNFNGQAKKAKSIVDDKIKFDKVKEEEDESCL